MNVTDAFDKWWKESFPMAPANKQSRENFIAFGGWLISGFTSDPAVIDQALTAYWDEAFMNEPLDSHRRMAAALQILLQPKA